MIIPRLSSRAIIGGYLGIAALAVFAMSSVPRATPNEPWFVIGSGLAWTAFSLTAAYIAYSRDDEAQREAQKFAWYHGGSIASVLYLIPLAWCARLGDRTELLAPERFDAVDPLSLILF